MENFDLRKYLAEGRLFEEDMTSKAVSVLKSYKGEVKGLEDYIKYLINTKDDISSSIQAVADDMDRDNDAEDSLRRDLEKLSLAKGKLIKELSPEMRKVMDQEKAKVEDTLQAFDRENPDYRYKSYDVNDHEGEIFVVYNTQADYDQIRGKEALLDLLSNFQYPVYVHYTVRDDYRSDNHDIYSKKGYELA